MAFRLVLRKFQTHPPKPIPIIAACLGRQHGPRID